MTSLTFRLDVEPKPTPRPRARIITPKGRRPIVSMYSPKDYREYLDALGEALGGVVAHKFDGPLLVKVDCISQRPKTTKLIAPKPDVDNYAKGVLDAITKDGRFWDDDSQVTELIVTKTWGEVDTSGHITVSIGAL